MDKFFKCIANLKLFFQGAFNHKAMSISKIEESLVDGVDQFLFLCFSENLGIELPTSYYTLELLPYLRRRIGSLGRKNDRQKKNMED
ncbi:hypothetical protein [Psychrilyobacter sp.]|uniref:hypothetical protein n=1 Tax=Psychrilyobacter sp. TaxID=2586924 RepID=UPI0030192CEA